MSKRWDGDTVCIVASGPSLTIADAQHARLAARRVIAVNSSWQRARRADVLYAADAAWWQKNNPPPREFTGERWASARNDAWRLGVPTGLNLAATKPGVAVADDFPIYEGMNSGFQAMGLAVAWGARKIVFLGLDLSAGPNGESHWHGDHVGLRNPSETMIRAWVSAFEKVAPVLAARGVEVINASRRTALKCFPCKTVTHALP